MSYLEEAYHYTTNKKSLLETARHSKGVIERPLVRLPVAASFYH